MSDSKDLISEWVYEAGEHLSRSGIHMPGESWSIAKLEWWLDQYKNPEGQYVAPFELGLLTDDKKQNRQPSYEFPEQMVLGILGFCNCGHPDIALQALLNFLEILCEHRHLQDHGCYTDGRPSQDMGAEWNRRFDWADNAAERTFMFYWADFVGLTTHSGTVDGSCFPEPKAFELYAILKAIDLLDKKENSDS